MAAPKKAKPVNRKAADAKSSRAAGARPSSSSITKGSTQSKKKTAGRGKTEAKKTVAKKNPAQARTTAARKPAAKKTPPSAKGILSPAKTARKAAPPKDRLQELRKHLLQRREAIVKEAKDEIAKYVSGETRQLVDTALDDGDWATVDISEDINLSRLAAHRKTMIDIDETLRKMEEGTYGICEECGEEISEKRLQVLPSATLCIICQEHKEQLEAVMRREEE